ncbi:MAG: exosortase/archaeosortase family protein [Candidatus Heimdallarchaeota archaeon]|nr:exosortase/archaeosortase family protein [Candidatus Heimdallarchaeota archaeon]
MEKENNTSENYEKLDLGSKLDKRVEHIIKNRILRYNVSFILIAIVVYFYIIFEGNREEVIVRVFFFDMPSYLLVPIALVLAFIAIVYISWDDKIFKRFRTPGLYMILLTGIFYILIFSGADEYLFQLSLAKWLTQATAVIVVALVKLFGLNIVDTTWNADDIITIIQFEGPNGLSSIGIDARCSGIHSLTIFVAIFILMLFEARKRLKWSRYRTYSDLRVLVNKNGIKGIFDKQGSKTLLIVSGSYSLNILRVISILLVGMIGTYLVNIIRVTIIFIINYFQGWAIAGPIHNYLGYVFLMIWVPIFWLFVLPIFEKKKETIISSDSVNEPSDLNSESTDAIVPDSNVALKPDGDKE